MRERGLPAVAPVIVCGMLQLEAPTEQFAAEAIRQPGPSGSAELWLGRCPRTAGQPTLDGSPRHDIRCQS